MAPPLDDTSGGPPPGFPLRFSDVASASASGVSASLSSGPASSSALASGGELTKVLPYSAAALAADMANGVRFYPPRLRPHGMEIVPVLPSDEQMGLVGRSGPASVSLLAVQAAPAASAPATPTGFVKEAPLADLPPLDPLPGPVLAAGAPRTVGAQPGCDAPDPFNLPVSMQPSSGLLRPCCVRCAKHYYDDPKQICGPAVGSQASACIRCVFGRKTCHPVSSPLLYR